MSAAKQLADAFLKAAKAADIYPDQGWRVSVEENGDLHGDFLVVTDNDDQDEVLKQGEAGSGDDCEFAAMASTTGVRLALAMQALLRRCAAWKAAAKKWRDTAAKQQTQIKKLTDLRERDAYIAHLKRAVATAVEVTKHDEEEIKRLRALVPGEVLLSSGARVHRLAAKSAPAAPPSIQELALAHFCERCSGFVQHCPTLDVQTRLQVAERIVELRREDLAEAKNRTSLYDHEEEMLENAEQVLQEVKEEAAADTGGADAARPS